jgi:hypothetical protein
LKTHHGWALVPGTGKRDMVPPDHPSHPHHHTRSGNDPPLVGRAATDTTLFDNS